MGNKKTDIIVSPQKNTGDKLHISFRKLTAKEHKKYRTPVYKYLVP